MLLFTLVFALSHVMGSIYYGVIVPGIWPWCVEFLSLSCFVQTETGSQMVDIEYIVEAISWISAVTFTASVLYYNHKRSVKSSEKIFFSNYPKGSISLLEELKHTSSEESTEEDIEKDIHWFACCLNERYMLRVRLNNIKGILFLSGGFIAYIIGISFIGFKIIKHFSGDDMAGIILVTKDITFTSILYQWIPYIAALLIVYFSANHMFKYYEHHNYLASYN
ncbi:MAG: hypothetical protein AAF621_08515, partial [Pseudomonadota bacterium]